MKRIVLTLVTGVIATAILSADSSTRSDAGGRIEAALQRLPYYGVFDFLAYSVDKGTVTLAGQAYRGSLKQEAFEAVKRINGIDDVANKIEILPSLAEDDRIRWATFYRIYTDDFLSRYTPGGAMAARYDAYTFARYPGMQPYGMYPIHIIVKNGRTTLVGIVDSEADKTIAGFRAREIDHVFSVENELIVRKS